MIICYAASYKAAFVISSNGFYSCCLDQKELSKMNCLQITHGETPLTVMSVCTLYSFSYSYPSLLFPYPFITFYIFPYFFPNCCWFYPPNIPNLVKLSNQVSFPIDMSYSSKFLNRLWVQFRFYISYRFSGLSTTHTINKKHLQIFMICGSSAVDSFQRAKQESDGNKDCSVL